MTISETGTQFRGPRAPAPPPLHLARRALRHLPLFLFVLALGLAATWLAFRATHQVYRSEAVILYRQTARQGHGDGDSARRVGSRLQDLLQARERLRRVADELRLHPELADRDAAVDQVRKRLGFHVRDGSTFQVTFDAASPDVAQATVDRLTRTLIADSARQRAREAEETRRLLEVERRRLEDDVRTREAALARFLQAHPEAAFPREPAGAADPTGEATALEGELARLRGSALRGQDTTERLDPDLLAAARRAETDAQQARRDLTEKQERLTDAHPDMIAARDRVRQLDEHARLTRKALEETRVRAPAAAGDDREAQIGALQRDLARVRRSGRGSGPRINRQALQDEVELQSLRHELEQARTRLAGVEDRQFQTALVAKLETSGEIGQLSILDPASRPGLPVVDMRKKVALAGIAGALLLALGAALLRARTDDRIHDRADAEWLGGQNVLVTVPPVPAARRSHG